MNFIFRGNIRKWPWPTSKHTFIRGAEKTSTARWQ